MALTQRQYESILDCATAQIQELVASGYDINNDKDIQRLYMGIDKVYKQLNETIVNHVPQSVYETYMKGLEGAEQALKDAGIAVSVEGVQQLLSVAQSPIHLEAMANIVSDTLTDLQAATRTAQAYGHKELDKALNDVRNEIANGYVSGATTQQITKRVSQKFGNYGMTSFITSDGKHLPLDFYGKTVTRTKLQTADNHAHLNRYKEKNVKHVFVTGNIPTCHECAPYRNRVFSTERDDEFPYVDLHTTFPKHPNCQCNFRPWIKAFKSDEEVQKEKEKASSFNPDEDVRSENERQKYERKQRLQAKARRKQHTYNKLKAHLGAQGPTSYEEFKRASPRQYHTWLARYKNLT